MPTTVPAETRTLIRNVSWETYVALCEERQDAIPRMSYANGMLELMSPKKEHEIIGSLLGRLVFAFCEHFDREVLSVASTTFRREDLARGFEADEAFYFENADRLRCKEEIDLTTDPSPELVVEIEITSSAIAKLELFAAMGVAEVWRHDGQQLTSYRLRGADYSEVDASVALPGFPIQIAERMLHQRLTKGEVAIVKEFKALLDA